jgi:hypothetical protein
MESVVLGSTLWSPMILSTVLIMATVYLVNMFVLSRKMALHFPIASLQEGSLDFRAAVKAGYVKVWHKSINRCHLQL